MTTPTTTSRVVFKLLRAANKAGIQLFVEPDGAHMRVIAPRRPKPKMTADLKSSKPAILEVLKNQGFPTPPVEVRQLSGDLVKLLGERKVLGFDLETTARPGYEKVRNAALSTVMGRVCTVQAYSQPDGAYVCQVSDDSELEPLRRLLESKHGPILVGHNIAYDLSMLAAAGLPIPPGHRIFDTMLAANLIDSSGQDHFPPHALDDLVERYFDLYLPKTEQVSDWSVPELSDRQVIYAATDAYAAWKCYEHQRQVLADNELEQVMALEMAALPAAVRLLRDGTPFDVSVWSPLAAKAEVEYAEVCQAILDLLGPDYANLNLRSAPQRLNLLKARGHKPGRVLWRNSEQEWHDSTDKEALLELRLLSDDPLLELLQRWGVLNTRVTRYGVRYPQDHVKPDGRLHGGYRALGTATGRAICAQPNLLQIPREGPGSEYRQAFRAPPGRVIVHADYSQIQLRIGADRSMDATLIQAYRAGADIHTLTASRLYNREPAAIAKDSPERQTGKTCGLALEFGMGADKLRIQMLKGGQLISLEEARRLHQVFHQTYPGLQRWIRRFEEGPIDLRTDTGRRRTRVNGYTMKPNSTAQMIEVDGMKSALALLAEHWDEVMPASAKLVLLIYDEIDIECDAADAAHVEATLKDFMVRGMQPFLRKVPVEVDTKVWQSWGGDPPMT